MRGRALEIPIILEKAVQDGQECQGFDSESLVQGGGHYTLAKGCAISEIFEMDHSISGQDRFLEELSRSMKPIRWDIHFSSGAVVALIDLEPFLCYVRRFTGWVAIVNAISIFE